MSLSLVDSVRSCVKRAAAVAVGLCAVFASGGAWAEVPSGFVQLEYIQGNGSSTKILTNFTPNPTTDKIVAEVEFPTVKNAKACTIWCARGSSTTTKTWTLFRVNTDYLRADYNSSTAGTVKDKTVINTKYTVTYDRNAFTWTGGSGYTHTAASTFTAAGGPLMLFASYCNGTGSNNDNYGNHKLYSFRIYRNDALIHDYVPCKDASGNATLCDAVAENPSTLTRTGTFVAGPQCDRVIVSGTPEQLGTPDPDYGVFLAVKAGESYTFTCPAAYTNDAETVGAVCTGWKLALTNGTATSGSELTKTITYGKELSGATLTWQWDVSYKVTATTEAGSVTTSSAWVKRGECFTSTVSATDKSCTFSRWADENGATVGTSAALSLPITKPMQLTAKFRDRLYVAKDGSDANAGNDPDAPLLTIEAAIAKALSDGEGTLVSVGPGTYTATNTTIQADSVIYAIYLNKQRVAIVSTDGPAVTTIDAGTDTTRAEAKICASGALISGFTIKNGCHSGKTRYSGVNVTSGSISNCWLSVRGHWANNFSHLNLASGTKGWDLQILPGSFNASESSVLVAMNGATVEGLVITNFIHSGTAKPFVSMSGASVLRNALLADCRIGGVDKTSISSFVSAGDTSVISDATFVNNRITANEGVLSIGKATVVVTNCIFWGNSSRSANADFTSGSNKARVFSSCSAELTGGERGNLDVNPQFVDFANHDYNLRAVSQAKAMGAPWLRPSGAATELQCAADGDVYTSGVGESLNVTFTGYAAGAVGAVSATWNFGDGSTSTDWPVAKHLYATPGRYTVTLTLSDESGGDPVIYTIPNSVTVIPTTCYVKEGSTGEFPYDTWAKAAPDLIDAVNVGSRHIIVTNGTYTVPTPQIAIGRALSITSVEGPSNTTIKTASTAAVNRRHFTVTHADVFISGFTLEKGYAAAYEWWAVLEMSAGTISNCVVQKTERVSRSAAVRLYGTAKAYDCVFDGKGMSYDNQGTGTGGIYLTGNAVLDRCIVRNYKVAAYSCDGVRGPLMMNASGVVVRNTLVTGCGFGSKRDVLDSGGGVVIWSGTLENCTIVNNSCGGYGGGIYVRGSSPTIRNCIVWGNSATAENGADIYSAYAGVVPTYTCAGSFADVSDGAGVGCTTKNPNFDDSGTNAWHLTALSTGCVDKGLDQTWMEGALDLDRMARVHGDAVDMGCYEFSGSTSVPLDGSIDATAGVKGRVPVELSFEANIVGDEKGLGLVWNFGDGSAEEAGGKTIKHTFATSGSYEVSAVVTNVAGERKTIKLKDKVTAVPQTCYVSKLGTNESPYDTWEKAASEISTVVELAPKTIIVSNGTYKATGDGIVLSSDIELKSLNGPEVTKINGQTTCRNVWLLDERAVCSGFSLINGYGNWDLSDIAATVTKGTLTNCVVPSIWGGQYRSPVIRVGAKGKVTGCVINCSGMGGNDNGSNYFCSTLVNGGTIENCEIKNYSQTSGELMSTPRAALTLLGSAVARNILVTNCRMTPVSASGQAMAAVVITGSGTLENCTIAKAKGCYGGAGLTITSAADATPVVRNCIITDCESADGSANADVRDVNSPNAPRVTYSCSADLKTGEGNVSNTNGLFTTRASRPKYSLGSRSPAKDAGKILDWMTPEAIDLIGNPRKFGYRPDMGCYESQTGGLLLLVR